MSEDYPLHHLQTTHQKQPEKGMQMRHKDWQRDRRHHFWLTTPPPWEQLQDVTERITRGSWDEGQLTFHFYRFTVIYSKKINWKIKYKKIIPQLHATYSCLLFFQHRIFTSKGILNNFNKYNNRLLFIFATQWEWAKSGDFYIDVTRCEKQCQTWVNETGELDNRTKTDLTIFKSKFCKSVFTLK